MKYYSEESLIKNFLSLGYSKTASEIFLENVNPVLIPDPSSDRERIRMELWKEAYLLEASEDKAKWAVDAFDKQFHNS